MQYDSRLKRLVFDVDGVFADFVTAFLDLVNRRYGLNLTKDQWVSYWPVNDGIMTKEQFEGGFTALANTSLFWANLNPLPGIDFASIEADMKFFRYNAYFVTRRRDPFAGTLPDAQAQTKMFLEQHGLRNYSAIIATSHKERVALVKLLEADAYLDDWGEQFLEAREAGVNAYLLDAPYNRDVTTPYRVYSVQEFIDINVPREVSCATAAD